MLKKETTQELEKGIFCNGNEAMCFGVSLPEAYHQALYALWKYGLESECPDWNTKQKELSMTMVVEKPLQEPMVSRLFIGGPEELEQYRQEMLDGILDFEIGKGNWKYTYHDRMVRYPLRTKTTIDQLDFIVKELKRNPESRRAVVDIRDNSMDCGSEDPACLQHIQYFIRDGKLNCKVLFRSNDACKAAFMNAFALILLQQRIAEELGVEMGTYTHRANSFHCYAKDYPMLDGYVANIQEEQANGKETTYDYVGDWQEMMEEAKGRIQAKVEELKR